PRCRWQPGTKPSASWNRPPPRARRPEGPQAPASGDIQYRLADHAALLIRRMRLPDILERVTPGNVDAQRAIEQRIENVIGAAVDFRTITQMIGEPRPGQQQGPRFAELERIEIGHRTGNIAVVDDQPALACRAEAVAQRRFADRVVHHVD